MNSGQLYIVSTPIGNLDDLSSRAIDTLKSVDLIAAEDTRRISKLLQRFEISKKLVRCDEAVERKTTDRLLRQLLSGESIALVSDAGAPNLSDPGAFLVEKAAAEGVEILPIPGPSALTASLSVCGFPALPFSFVGFMEKKGKKRTFQLEKIEKGEEAVVFFESPFRIQKTFQALAKLIPDRMAFLGRELTKLHEEHFRGSVAEIASALEGRSIKGEFTGVIRGKTKKELKEEARRS